MTNRCVLRLLILDTAPLGLGNNRAVLNVIRALDPVADTDYGLRRSTGGW
jgi:hypothetical protein